jgi:hypothetical protein
VTKPVPTLTKWQRRRRRGAPLERIVMATLFLALAVAMIVYFSAILRIISPVFW